MVNAVVLAGGKTRKTLGDLVTQITNFPVYWEVYMFGRHKALTKLGGEIDGITKRRPIIEYVLHSLNESKNIENIVVVGDKEKLERGLDVRVKTYMKRCRIIQQVGSLKENAMHGYSQLDKKGHTLFITADAPKTTHEGIDDFLSKCKNDMNNYDFFFPIVSRKYLKQYEKVFHRPYLWVVDDLTNTEDEFMEQGRKGFRISSMVLANPENIKNKDFIDFAYSTRKLRNPLNIIELFGFWPFKVGPFKEEFSKYMHKTLRLLDIENKLSELFGTRFKLVEIYDATSSLDVDAFGDEKKIEKINNYHPNKS